ncbi:hypothetical protein M436DRAFT_46784 [Aureobasidium namibiae CBS 147.97]|uniref:Uncharacterized protein n=1 Tax=Aureobasidium namibiae CBS 147.97 TaxID=1043004 RepID=A0A074WP96_9PEZI|nr:uncharacterized protein M436DRAFT_46784 [Aureobasidium namibiae CBS 147.97]KEQ73424.1 hypothetical protein M436DRAFT_46784 [Aureobasidium namibiae CBS 147.97]
MDPASSAKINHLEHIVGAIDVAFGLALTDLPPRALSGFRVTEKSSFKHLHDICPAMWSPGHVEALASRAVFLPTVSHAISNSISQRARSFSLREKLKEIARQEHLTASSGSRFEPRAIQKAVGIRLWRLTQRRLRDPSAAKKLQPIRTSDTITSTSEQDEDVDKILSFELDDNHLIYPQLETCLGSDDEVNGEDLLETGYESEWEDLFTDPAAENPVNDDEEMLDCLHIVQHDDDDEDMFSGDLEDDISSALEEMLEL